MEDDLEALARLRKRRERLAELQMQVLARQERIIVRAAKNDRSYRAIARASGLAKSWVAELVNRRLADH